MDELEELTEAIRRASAALDRREGEYYALLKRIDESVQTLIGRRRPQLTAAAFASGVILAFRELGIRVVEGPMDRPAENNAVQVLWKFHEDFVAPPR